MRRAHLTLDQQPELAVRLCAHLGLNVTARLDPSGDEELFPNRMVLEGPDAPLLMTGKGQALDALQFLLHEAHGERDESKVVYLDVRKTRLYRMVELKGMAGIGMVKAREYGSHAFASLTPRERRWIHTLVAREQDLATESEGTGNLKTLKILRKG